MYASGGVRSRRHGPLIVFPVSPMCPAYQLHSVFGGMGFTILYYHFSGNAGPAVPNCVSPKTDNWRMWNKNKSDPAMRAGSSRGD
jgi:hypothetical protein